MSTMPGRSSEEASSRIAVASSTDEVWLAITASRLYDGCDSSPSYIADVLRALLVKARAEEPEQWCWLFATYARVAYTLGLRLFDDGSIEAQLGEAAEDPWPTPEGFWGFLQSRDPRARAAATVAIGYSTRVCDGDLATLRGLADEESDEGVAAMKWLICARWASQLRMADASRVVTRRAAQLASRSKGLLRVVAGATMAVAGEALPEPVTDALLEAVRNPKPLPREWGMFDSFRTRTTAGLALDVLRFARVERPAERAVELLTFDRGDEACSAAFQMTFVTPRASFPYGPVLSELTESQLRILKQAANASVGDFEALGIGQFAIGRFLAREGFAYRPYTLVVEGAPFVAHFGAVVRRVAIGDLEVDVAARALVETSSTRELLEGSLVRLALVARLHPSALERGRIGALLTAAFGILRARDPHFRERLIEALDKAHRTNAVPAHLALALEFLLVDNDELPAKYEAHVLDALQDPDATEQVRRLLRRLPPEQRQRLVLQSGARRHTDLCLTRAVVEWLLREVTEENVDETLAILANGSEETRRLLSEMRPLHEPAETVRALAEEALGVEAEPMD